jgi:hypothetical protein
LQSISFTATQFHHNTEWRVWVNTGGTQIYSDVALVTVNKVTSIKSVDVVSGVDLIGVAYAKGAYVALSAELTSLARRSTDGGNTWTYSYLPAARYWDGIVSTSQGVLIAYSGGDSGVYDILSRRANGGTLDFYWGPVVKPVSALIARSFDGGLTWDTAVPKFFMGSDVRMWSFPWNNVLIATWRDDSTTEMPPAIVALDSRSVTNNVYNGWKITPKRYGRRYIGYNYNNGSGDSWARYELPTFLGTNSGATQILGTWYGTACPSLTSLALSPSGLLVATSRYQGFEYDLAGTGYGNPRADALEAYDRKGYLMYRDLSTGLGTLQVADTATSASSVGVSSRKLLTELKKLLRRL